MLNPDYRPDIASLQAELAAARARVRELETEVRFLKGERQLEPHRGVFAAGFQNRPNPQPDGWEW